MFNKISEWGSVWKTATNHTYFKFTLLLLFSSSSFQELVLVENTGLSEQNFSAVQKFVVFDLGLTLLPVSGQTEASQLITQIVSNQDKTINLQTIPIWFGDTIKCVDSSLINALVEYLWFS